MRGLDRPISFPEVEGPRYQDNRHMNVVRLLALLTGRLFPQELFLELISVRGWVNLSSIVLTEELFQKIIPMTPLGIEPVTSRFVAQCLNQLCHHVPLQSVAVQEFFFGFLDFFRVNKGPTHRPSLHPKKVSWCSFLLEDKSTATGWQPNCS
jgi:hypothetical protein